MSQFPRRSHRLCLETLELRRLFHGDPVELFLLEDVNESSSTYQQFVSPTDFSTFTTGWYFGQATCSSCRTDFERLDRLQDELRTHYPASPTRLLGINKVGAEIGNASMTSQRDIPWLQDGDTNGDGQSDVWLNSWPYEYRDVVLVDGDGEFHEVFNLAENDLTTVTSYELLKGRLLGIASYSPATEWQAPVEPLDVDNSSRISPVDALLVVNELGVHPQGQLPPLAEVGSYVDTDGDGVVSPVDALLVINQLDVIAASDFTDTIVVEPQIPARRSWTGNISAASEIDDGATRLTSTNISTAPVGAACDVFSLRQRHRVGTLAQSNACCGPTDNEANEIDEVFSTFDFAERL